MTPAAALLAAAALSIAAARINSAAAAGAAARPDRHRRSDDPFAERIQAEVSALGFEVVAVEPWRTGEAIESLDAAGRANQAAAAIRMVASRKGVEIWVANQPTGRSLMRQLVVDERARAERRSGGAADRRAAAHDAALAFRDATAAAPPRPTISRRATPVAPPPPNLGLQAATGGLESRGGSVGVQAWGTLHRFVVRPFGIALDFSAPLLRHRQRPRRRRHRRCGWQARQRSCATNDRAGCTGRGRRRGGDSPQRERGRQGPVSRPARSGDGRRGLRARRRRLVARAGCASVRARSRASCPRVCRCSSPETRPGGGVFPSWRGGLVEVSW